MLEDPQQGTCSTLRSGGCFDEFVACVAAEGIFVALGAGIGALIDYTIKGKTVVYRAKQGNVTATPVLIGSRGLGIVVRF